MKCGLRTLKYSTMLINLAIGMSGLVILIAGVMSSILIFGVESYLVDKVHISSTILSVMVLGLFIFVIFSYGCYGITMENKCAITTYSILLLLVLMAETAIGTLVFVNTRCCWNDEIVDGLTITFDYYGKRNKQQNETVDHIQSVYECCGVNGPSDWKSQLPSSCCESENATCLLNDPSVYQIGCLNKMKEVVNVVGLLVGTIIFAVSFIVMAGIILSLYLSTHVRTSVKREKREVKNEENCEIKKEEKREIKDEEKTDTDKE